MRTRVVVTGMGCISPVGNDVETTWNNIKGGVSGTGKITLYDATDHRTTVAAEVKDYDPNEIFGRKEARRLDRFSQFALSAALQAVEHARLEINDSNRERIGGVIGTGIGGLGTLSDNFATLHKSGPSRISPFLVPMMLPDTAGGMIAINLGIQGPNMAVVTACATGTNAVGEAAEVIRRGQADVMLAGATEAAILPISVGGLSVMTALTANPDPESASRPFDAKRDGFVMGEGAAVLVLEALEHAQERGATIYAEVVGYGITNDAYHISAPSENGSGAARCMRMALDNAGMEIGEIDYINAHGTSTPLNDKSETAAIKTVFGEQAYDMSISSTKSMTGHLVGASGTIEALISTKAINENIAPPTINYENPDPECDLDYVPNAAREMEINTVMSNSFGFGGHNATIILKSFQEANGS
ncbi:MAG: beta-ketoacyl-[acyl-carrier-protein] synthase II [Chloroflexi bacterium]|nr:MAG: beta-ketoacyl-[acyl-carrier-protein] synthase II [Chloroflexota bacterium]MBL1195862.1 beta-ketoacyl-[acyl-carrier-protein] synthase II [Chloroflexota bacterium]NOH13154.1 beta-ketoacyl-ACP synthase II [Chloroflexota bacterium]